MTDCAHAIRCMPSAHIPAICNRTARQRVRSALAMQKCERKRKREEKKQSNYINLLAQRCWPPALYLDFAGRQLKCLQFFRRVQCRHQNNIKKYMAMKKVQTIVYQLENG